MKKTDINPLNILAALSASIGSGFQHGYHDVIVNIAYSPIREWIIQNKKDRYLQEPTDQEIKWIWSLLVSVFSFGGILGSALTACFANKFGHKNGLLLNNLTMFVATSFLCTAKYADMYEILLLGRFLIGVNAGLNSGLCPIYLSETAPAALRGAATALYTFMYTASLSLSFTLCLENVLGNKELWPYLFSITIVPSIIQMVGLWQCPESARVLMINLNDEERAKKSLKWYRQTEDVEDELNSLKEIKVLLTEVIPPISLKSLFKNSLYRTPLIISLAMVLGQHLCGVYTAVYYSNTFMESIGISPGETQLYATIMGIMLLIFSLASVILIEFFGRRLLFLVSLCGLAFDTIYLTITIHMSQNGILKEKEHFMVVMGVVLFAGWYGLGVGTVPIVITVELFHHLARPVAASVVVPIGWLSNFIVHMIHVELAEKLGIYIFALYILADLLLFLFAHTYLPETKGKRGKEIIQFFYFLNIDESEEATY